MKKRFSTILYILLFIVIDQISKYFFYDKWFLWNSLLIEPAFNTWISRSLPVNRIIVIILTLIVIIAIFWWYHKNYIWRWWTILLVWWAIWNIIDRIFLWWVRDFIRTFRRFPIFNFADICICVWMGLVIIKWFFNDKIQKS